MHIKFNHVGPEIQTNQNSSGNPPADVPPLSGSLQIAGGKTQKDSGPESKVHRSFLQKKLQKLLDRTGLSLSTRRTGQDLHIEPAQSTSEPPQLPKVEPPQAFPSVRCLPSQLPQRSELSPFIISDSDALPRYLRLTPIEQRSAAGYLNYMKNHGGENGEQPINLSHDALAIYCQTTPVKNQTGRGFWEYMNVAITKGRGSPIRVNDKDMLDQVIFPSIEKQIEDFKNEYEKNGVIIDQLSPSFRPLYPGDFDPPEVVEDVVPPPLPPKGPARPPKVPLA